MTEVEYVNEELIHMDRSTFMWVSVKDFRIDGSLENHRLLRSLMSCRRYHDLYIGDEDAGTADPQCHASWPMENLSVEMFECTDADAARTTLNSWANDEAGRGNAFHPSEEAMGRLEDQVFPLLRRGEVYEFHPPEGEETMHQIGGILGSIGFHEFVMIDRKSARLHLVVASDD